MENRCKRDRRRGEKWGEGRIVRGEMDEASESRV